MPHFVPKLEYTGFRLYDRVQAVVGLPTMPVIVADSIAKLIDALPDIDGEQDFNFSPDYYGIVAPPFPQCFIEATSVIQQQQRMYHGKVMDIGRMTIQRGVVCYDADAVNLSKYYDELDYKGHAPEGTRWTLVLFGYIWANYLARQNIRISTFPSPAFIYLDDQGLPIASVNNRIATMPLIKEPYALMPICEKQDEDIREVGLLPLKDMAHLVPFALKAISAMHQRVEVEKVIPGRSVKRAAKRELMKANIYYVLNVKPTPVNTLEDFRRIGTPERAGNRSHTVRGHFRYYSPDKPLFGRYSGMYWVPEHRRGSDDYGEIIKDYKV